MQFLLKTSRSDPAEPLDASDAQGVLKRLRHQGRKLVEVFVIGADGSVDRYQERTRRKLGSNAIASRTWLCETSDGDDWTDGRYIPEPLEAIHDMDPEPNAVILVLMGAEGSPESTIEQLRSIPSAT